MRFATALCLGVLVALAPATAQDQLPTFTSSSDNVSVFTTITDKSGRLVTDLTRDDFEIFDEGKVQPLKVFDKTPQPIRLIVLIDVSGSMWGNLPLVRDAARELISRLLPGDLARIGTFGNEIHLSPNFTRDEAALLAELPRDIGPSARTPLWQATDMAMNEFGSEAGRRVILILSDGKDSGPIMGRRYLTPIEIGERAERDDVMIYGIGMQSRSAGGMMPGPGANIGAMIADSFPDPALGRVALDSGGGYFELRARDDFGATFARVADELHQQYLLGFAPPKLDGKTHKLEIKVARKDVKVRARKTYRAPKSS
jgi:Ca-activated chloride channel family protein